MAEPMRPSSPPPTGLTLSSSAATTSPYPACLIVPESSPSRHPRTSKGKTVSAWNREAGTPSNWRGHASLSGPTRRWGHRLHPAGCARGWQG